MVSLRRREAPRRRGRRGIARRAVRRALGIGFLALLLGLGALTYASFQQAFVPVAHVTLETSHIGLQLDPRADVKLRGQIVGEVRSVSVQGKGARIDLALDPKDLAGIPADVTARILPKTLFGEKYVELEPPAGSSGGSGRTGRTGKSLAAGGTIRADRSAVGTEVEQVLNDVEPLLRTIRPEQLSATLNALSTALEGRGDRIGGNLVRLNNYLGKLEPHVPTLTSDLRDLGAVADTYREATPDLMRLLENTTKTGRTVVLKQRALEDFLTELATTSDTARDFLADNEDQLIRLGRVTRPTLDLLAAYSPEYPCLLEGMANWIPRMNDAFGGSEQYAGSAPALHITVELGPQRSGYTRDDEPAYLDDRGPGCRDLPNPPYSQENPAPPSDVQEGIGSQPGPGDAARDERVFRTSSGYAGSPQEKAVLDSIVGPATHTPADRVPDIATLLFGPLARGAEVSQR